jgi:hypothetical protein
LVDVDLGRTVNIGLRDALNAGVAKAMKITNAEADQEVKIRQGLGEKSFRTNEGEGIAKARELLLIAESVGLSKMAEIAKTPEGQKVMLIQQTREMYEKAKYSVLPGDGGGLYGAVVGIQEVLKRVQENDKDIKAQPAKTEKRPERRRK